MDHKKQDTALMGQSVPAFELFQHSSATQKEELQRWQIIRKESQLLRMPYKRYLAILPLMQEQKIEQHAREQSELLKRRLCPTEPAPADIKLEVNPKKEEVDELYNLPLKEQLKRKHQTTTPSTIKRSRNEENNKPSTSVKSETFTDTPKIGNVDDSDDDDDVVEVPIDKNAPETKPSTQSKQQQKRQQNNKRFKAKLRIPEQSSNRPVPTTQSNQGSTQHFDYKNVDFRQFQGGAQRARGTEIKTQMRGKVSEINKCLSTR